MDAVTLLQAISGSLYLVVVSIIGIRLLMLAKRNRALPEFYLGISLVVGGTLGASLEAGAMASHGTLAPERIGMMLGLGKSFGLIAQLTQGLFIWRVFRPEAKWAGCLVAGLCSANVIAFMAFAHHGSFSNGVLPLSLFAVEFAIRISASIWLCCEAGRYYHLMRLRRGLGLADPIVTNRFLLWTLAGISGLVMLSTSVPPVLYPTTTNPLMALDIVLFSVSGLASAFFYMLTFFPPAAYRRWIEGGVQQAS